MSDDQSIRPAGFSGRWFSLHPNVRGALWITLGAVFFSFAAMLVKYLGASLHTAEITFFRCLFGLIALLPFVIRQGVRNVMTTERLPLLLLRSAFGVTAMACGFYAITHLTLADATAIGFTKPLFMVMLAAFFLGETVRWRRTVATLIGFLGVIVMVRPGDGGFDSALLVGLFGAACVAIAMTLVKRLTATESPMTLLVYASIVSTVLTLGPALYFWTAPTWLELACLALLGGLASLAQSFVIRGYRVGDATVVTPFDYTRLLFATIIGFFVFAEVPDIWTFAGAGIIVGSTLYIARREAKLGKPAKGMAEGMSVRG